MVSKPKKRQVRKVVSATREPKKSPKQDKTPKTDKSIEALIESNGNLVENLYTLPVYLEIIRPLIKEGIASVSGRLTNGRYYHGSFTRPDEKSPLEFQRGYQNALMDFHNYLNDFVIAKNKLRKDREAADINKNQPLYNPFMEDEYEQD